MQIVINMMDSGPMARKMVQANIFKQMAPTILENGKMI